MWPRTAKFDAAVQEPHDVAVHASLWSPGRRDLLADGLDVHGGSVTASASASHRRSAQVNLVDRDGTLARLFPPGRTVRPLELVISRGIAYPDGTRELIPLGVFACAEVKTPLWPGAAFDVSAYDLSRRVSRNTFTSPHAIQPGTPYVQAAADLVRGRLPFAVDVEITTGNSDATAHPVVYFEQDDPWASAGKLAAAAGCELFFDQLARLVIRDEHSVKGSPDFSYLDGVTSIILPESEQTSSDAPGYNAVLVTGESSDNSTAVPRFLAYDDRPESDTYYYGDYGQVTEYVNDPAAGDDARAELIARSRLQRHLGRGNSMELAAVPHPAHDPSDIVRVRYGANDQLMQLESAAVPLDAVSAGSLSLHAQLAVTT